MNAPLLQEATFVCKDGEVLHAEVPAFPNNPSLVIAPVGSPVWGLTRTAYFAVNEPVLGFGEKPGGYHEVEPYELPA